ncbi:hypothetical protein Barb6_03950 [Bacteroidales bacterium Barb6]|nr:hypothetical protein Barb6_03950 [Bacteroidales bacterium Barb6]
MTTQLSPSFEPERTVSKPLDTLSSKVTLPLRTILSAGTWQLFKASWR